MYWNPQYAILMLLSTLITYICALLIGKDCDKKGAVERQKRNKNIYLFICCSANIGILVDN